MFDNTLYLNTQIAAMLTRILPPHSLITIILLIGLTSNVAAGSVKMGNIIPGAGLISRNIVSMRELKFVNIVPQKTDFSCGAAALATILRYAYGHDITESEVIEGLLTVSDPELVKQKGFSLLDLKNYVKSHDMRARGYRMDAELLAKIKIPVIVLLNIRGYKHFVVVKKTTHDKVYIADPALGNRIMDRASFTEGWNRVVFAVIGQGYDRESILLKPKGPLTAKTMTDSWRPLTDRQLIEFGFRSTELF
jgi:predicted double-glycine peptidase